ncbi:MetQ/NlpA family lipoprotein [Heliobacterium gestii]|uniref:Lipoprotein n=1 Tax=Heliomicrobium gestii TaxID=2699 RepID=A0A845L9H6_HELGE|nr:MetQ/NlpA family ABC transporter substrate-binding protein [Heliomicrobium gestii]MBM7868199.1 D-methionine transport system substrate-binding protein [Heliomicrobium gestii]MZP43397.1 MetQ/NlpA family lipoprotein [Heliomicrobium gestii]
MFNQLLQKKITPLLGGLLVLSVAALGAVGCSAKDTTAGNGGQQAAQTTQTKTIRFGVSPVPHAEIAKIAKDLLAKDGIELKIVEFNDYVQPNLALADGELDANFFQHKPYLDTFAAEHKLDLKSVAGVDVAPMGVYSQKVKSLADLKEKAKVAIPNDPTNGGRALLLLQSAGLIKLDPNAGVKATTKDIKENPKGLKITELEAAMLPKVLDDADIAVINTNFALGAGLNPLKDALTMEGKDSPYVNIVVVKNGNENNEAIQKLVKALTSAEVKKFIDEKYKGAVVPAF